jgi:hypothetical protein
VADSCEHGTEPSSSIKDGEFKQLSDHYFLKDSAP